MQTLKLNILGSPQISLDEKPLVGFTTNKAQALLFYLAVTGEMHTRYTLATLLWSDASDRQARKNLRNVLYDLRPLVGSYLDITSQTVSFKQHIPYWLDSEVFTAGLKSPLSQLTVNRLDEIIRLYRGEFLEGFHVRNTTVFEEWVLMHREYFRRLFIQGLDKLARQCLKQQEYRIGLIATKRLLALEPWRETTHRQQMLCLAHTGQRNAALMQYETCRQILADELDTTPLTETTNLFEQLKLGQLPLPKKSRFQFETLPLSVVNDQVGYHPPRSVSTSSDKNRNDNSTIDPPPLPPVDWGAAPIHTPFYGRQVELNRLAQWLVRDTCRLVAVFGIGGQGKTALSVQLTDALLQNKFPDGSHIETGGFDRIIWRSLRNAPPFAHLLQDWLRTLTGQAPAQMPEHIDAQLTLLYKYLQEQRCLLILDDFHGLLQDGKYTQFSPGYEDYEQLLVRMVHADHQSCLLLTSREQPREFQYLAIDSSKVRSLPLTGLPQETSQKVLQAFGLKGSQTACSALIRRYSGNPVALKLAAMTIQNFFAGNIDQFIQENILIFDDLQSILDQQLLPLSLLEREIVTWLALEQKPVAFQDLWQYMAASCDSKWEFLAALQSLQRRCLLEKYVDGFAIQNLVAEYLNMRVVETICQEIESDDLLGETATSRVNSKEDRTDSLMATFLNRYALAKRQDAQDEQPEHVLQPIAHHLAARWETDELKQHLNQLLTTVQTESSQPRGYAKVNLYHILKAVSRIGSSDRGFSRQGENYFA